MKKITTLSTVCFLLHQIIIYVYTINKHMNNTQKHLEKAISSQTKARSTTKYAIFTNRPGGKKIHGQYNEETSYYYT